MQIIKTHLAAYPAMQPMDVIKLLYQRAFGGGHMIADAERALAYLYEEHKTVVQQRSQPYTEDIGGGFVRLYLDGIPRDSLHTVGRLFVRSAVVRRQDSAEFQRSLDRFTHMVRAGETPFSPESWEEALCAYRAAGCPMVRHSPAYRAAYAPAYRVIDKKYVSLLPLLFSLDAHIASAGRAVLAVDGMCGSGKSTLSRLLVSLYDAALISMDDFFLPPSLRTAARLAEPGGNIHYERFLSEVVPHLGTGDTFFYRLFDCSQMELGATVTLPACRLTLVEGSYALHPTIRKKYDVTAYLYCTTEMQKVRLAARNPALLHRFQTEWIPMETKYDVAFGIRAGADFVIDTTDIDWREEKE